MRGNEEGIFLAKKCSYVEQNDRERWSKNIFEEVKQKVWFLNLSLFVPPPRNEMFRVPPEQCKLFQTYW